jgi:1-deoxy-D-xylulose-5-phosphate reductoisomerase
MLDLCLLHKPRYAHMADAESAERLQCALSGGETTVVTGSDTLCSLVQSVEVDTVMAAIVGAAGLLSTLAAARAGKKLLLANKESLVMAGALLMDAASVSGAAILPIDSEHNAIFQCLHSNDRAVPSLDGVRSIILTASGGPFRLWGADSIRRATPAQAVAHPNWAMGAKISVDSASLMNKGLELIEASWLFRTPPSKIEVVVHPQSIVHSMVRYNDGSVLAQLGNPDMRTPIAYGLAWPERIDSGVAPLDFLSAGPLEFEAADTARFPCLRLAQESAIAGGTASAICNAANEVAVASFLSGRIEFGNIPVIVENTLANVVNQEPGSIDVVLEQDRLARQCALAEIERLSKDS